MLLGIIVYIKFGLSIDSILLFFILSLFFVLSVIDYDYHAVPDSINLMALSLSLFYIDFYSAIQSALMVAGAMALLRYYLSFILQKESMGEGDIILGATMGAILGIKLSFFALFLASIIALPFALYDKIKSKNGLVPFIPFLSIATILVIFEKEYFYNLLVKLYE
jgi:leader peptidase (prepilin peptidase)/N-methyltransferase